MSRGGNWSVNAIRRRTVRRPDDTSRSRKCDQRGALGGPERAGGNKHGDGGHRWRYFWIPPVWQSLHDSSGSSSPSGCTNFRPFASSTASCAPLPCARIVWHVVQSVAFGFSPASFLCLSSWQRKQPCQSL